MVDKSEVNSTPVVSVLTPTHNRHRYLPSLLQQFQEQDFVESMELVIHDSTPSCYPFVFSDRRVVYVHDPNVTRIGEKRNRINSIANGKILVCMDDDDIYYPTYVSECVRALRQSRCDAPVVARTAYTIIYSLAEDKLLRFSRENSNRCINSAMAYDKNFLKTHSYNNADKCNEEVCFLNKYSSPITELNCDKVGIHVVHTQNTACKKGKGTYIDLSAISTETLSVAHITLPYIYWINLAHRRDRSEVFLRKTKGLLHHRVNAVTKDHGASFDSKKSSDIEIACFLSHMKAMRSYLDNPANKCPYAVICEDDLLIPQEKLFYEQIFYYVHTAPSDWEILQLHRIVINADIPYSPALRWSAWEPHMFSTAIYIVRNAAAKRLVDQFRDGCDLVPYGRVVADHTIYSNATTYSADTPYFRTNDRFRSDINHRHADLQKKNNRLIISSSSRQGYPFEG